MDLFLSPFSDGVSTRRGSVMAALQHGVPVASTIGIWSDRLFEDERSGVATTHVNDGKASFGNLCADLAENTHWRRQLCTDGEATYRDNFEWHKLSEKVTEMMYCHSKQT